MQVFQKVSRKKILDTIQNVFHNEQKLLSFYIFKRQKVLLHGFWTKVSDKVDDSSTNNNYPLDLEKKKMIMNNNEFRLLIGLLFSLKEFCETINPIVSNEKNQSPPSFHSFSTPQYKLHCYENLTGYKFVLITNPCVEDMYQWLKELYTDYFVIHILRCPLTLQDKSALEKIFVPILEEFIYKRMSNIINIDKDKYVFIPG